MAKKKELSVSIAELLPEGLGVDLINKIAVLVNAHTVERVNEETSKLAETTTRQVKSFIRGQIEKLKEQAIKELELENETFRNAQLFETVRSMFAVELSGEDELNGINVLASVSEGQDQKINVLVGEVDRLLQENIRLKGSAKIVSDKNTMLESSISKLTESAKLVDSGKTQAKHMSDSAVVISPETFKPKEVTKEKKDASKLAATNNEWLNETVMSGLRTLVGK